MQLRDPTLLFSIIGLPSIDFKRALTQEIDVYSAASSSDGLLCIRKYWDAHCSTLAKLPTLALLDSNSYPRGLTDAHFTQLISRITDLKQWQIWDLWYTLDHNRCGYIGCPEFTLLVVLMCAGLSQQQMRAVHTYRRSIHKVFLGAHVQNPIVGITQCCQLLNIPVSLLVTAKRQLQPVAHHATVGTHKPAASRCGCCKDSSCRREGCRQGCCQIGGPHSISDESTKQMDCCCMSIQDSSGLDSNQSLGVKLKGVSSNRVQPSPSIRASSRLLCDIHTNSCNQMTTKSVTSQDTQLLLYTVTRICQDSSQRAIRSNGQLRGYKILQQSEETTRRLSSNLPGLALVKEWDCMGCVIC